jgi:hypothetical protein
MNAIAVGYGQCVPDVCDGHHKEDVSEEVLNPSSTRGLKSEVCPRLMGSGRPIEGWAAGWNARGPPAMARRRKRPGRAVERSCGKLERVGGRASRSRRDLPTDFRVAPEVELSILAENSLFFEKNSLLGLQNSPFHCSSSGTSSYLSDCVPEYLRSMVVRQGHISSR